jgi:predicted metal-binding membrane protein
LVANKPALASIAILCALAWAYLAYVASTGMDMSATSGMAAMPDMPDMPGMAMPMAHDWTGADFAAMFLMWAAMMVAMMLPSVMPMVVLYGRTNAHRAAQGRPSQPTWPFVAGYLIAWVAFSLLATFANWALHAQGYLTSMMGSATPLIGGILLAIAGIYQWTPLKDACLAHCRSPVGFLSDHWREGRSGAVRMGLHHGAYCVGCCWLLMALLFVLGVMNIAWIAVLAVFVLVEKTVPFGRLLSRAAGVFMLAWGVGLAALQ